MDCENIVGRFAGIWQDDVGDLECIWKGISLKTTRRGKEAENYRSEDILFYSYFLQSFYTNCPSICESGVTFISPPPLLFLSRFNKPSYGRKASMWRVEILSLWDLREEERFQRTRGVEVLLMVHESKGRPCKEEGVYCRKGRCCRFCFGGLVLRMDMG